MSYVICGVKKARETVTSRYVLHAVSRFWKKQENVINRKFNVLEFNILVRRKGLSNIFSFVLRTKYQGSCLTRDKNSLFNVKPFSILYLLHINIMHYSSHIVSTHWQIWSLEQTAVKLWNTNVVTTNACVVFYNKNRIILCRYYHQKYQVVKN